MYPTQQTLLVCKYFRCPRTGILYQYPCGYNPHVLGQSPQVLLPSYFPQAFHPQFHVNPLHNVISPQVPIIQPLRQLLNSSPPTVNFAPGTPPHEFLIDGSHYENQRYSTQLYVSESHNVTLPPPPITQPLPQSSLQSSPPTENFFYKSPPSDLFNLDDFDHEKLGYKKLHVNSSTQSLPQACNESSPPTVNLPLKTPPDDLFNVDGFDYEKLGFTKLHVNPSHKTLPSPPITQSLPQTRHQSSPLTTNFSFGTPPGEQGQFGDKSKKDSSDLLPQCTTFLAIDKDDGDTASCRNFSDLNETQVANLSSDDYITYVVNGCFIGEEIARQNRYRSYFKSIPNICNLMRHEVVKPHVTALNIYSQGTSWATKDFIFAFIRLTDSWWILKGYLGCKYTFLGQMEDEISQEFRNCYNEWEICSKRLMYHMKNIFINLEEASFPRKRDSTNFEVLENSATGSASIPLSPPPNCDDQDLTELLASIEAIRFEDDFQNESREYIKPGNYDVPMKQSLEPPVIVELPETLQEEDFDSECHIYMKPGNYRVPVMLPPTPLSEFEMWESQDVYEPDTARNVEVYKNKLRQSSHNLLQIGDIPQPSSSYDVTSSENLIHESEDINFYEHQRTSSRWDLRTVKLTNFTMGRLHKIFVELQRTDFASHVTKILNLDACTDAEFNNPTTLNTVENKLKQRHYTCLYEFVHDIRHIMSYRHSKVQNYFKHLAVFRNKFDDLLNEEFPHLDFQYVNGNSKELSGLLALKEKC